MYKKIYLMLCAAVVAGGCVDYTPPPAIIDGSSYTAKKTEGADERLAGISELSLAEAQRIALANNPTYLKGYHAIQAAKMRYYQALSAYSPQVTASFALGQSHEWYKKNSLSDSPSVNYDRTRTFYTSTGLQAGWLLFDGLSRYFSVKMASSEHRYYQNMEAEDCRVLMRSVAYAYNQIMLALENQKIALADMEFQQKNLKITQSKYEAGAVPRSDVLNFQIYVNSAEVNFIAAQYQYDVAVYALAVLMGYPEGTLPDTIKYSPIPTSYAETLPAVETYLDAALANRPDLRATRELMQIAKYRLYRTYSAYSPTVSAYANFTYNTTQGENAGTIYNPGTVFASDGGYVSFDNAGPTLDYGLQAQYTVFNGFARYNAYREAVANLASSHFDVATRWLSVINEVRGAYANYIQSVKNSKVLKKTLELTSEQRDLVQEEFDAGNVEITRLNEVQRDFVDAQSGLASAYINVQNAKAQLDAAVAELTAEYYSKGGAKTAAPEAAPAAAPEKSAAPQDAPAVKTAPAAKTSEAEINAEAVQQQDLARYRQENTAK